MQDFVVFNREETIRACPIEVGISSLELFFKSHVHPSSSRSNHEHSNETIKASLNNRTVSREHPSRPDSDVQLEQQDDQSLAQSNSSLDNTDSNQTQRESENSSRSSCDVAKQDERSIPESFMPPRIVIPTPHGASLFMPASTNDDLAIKIVHVRPENQSKSLPTVPGIVLYVDQETGLLKALFDGTILTYVRTSGLSGLATKYMSRSNAHTLTVFGAGNEAEWHIRAVVAVRPSIRRVFIVNRTMDRATDLARRMDREMPGRSFHAVESSYGTCEGESENGTVRCVEDAIRVADIICTCTNSSTPVLRGEFISPGTHINCIGSYKPTMQEVDTQTICRSNHIYCDASEAIWHEAGDFLCALEDGSMTKDNLLGDMYSIVRLGDKFLTDETSVRLFKSVGGSLFDTIIAGAAFRHARQHTLGQAISI